MSSRPSLRWSPPPPPAPKSGFATVAAASATSIRVAEGMEASFRAASRDGSDPWQSCELLSSLREPFSAYLWLCFVLLLLTRAFAGFPTTLFFCVFRSAGRVGYPAILYRPRWSLPWCSRHVPRMIRCCCIWDYTVSARCQLDVVVAEFATDHPCRSREGG